MPPVEVGKGNLSNVLPVSHAKSPKQQFTNDMFVCVCVCVCACQNPGNTRLGWISFFFLSKPCGSRSDMLSARRLHPWAETSQRQSDKVQVRPEKEGPMVGIISGTPPPLCVAGTKATELEGVWNSMMEGNMESPSPSMHRHLLRRSLQ